MRRGPWIEGHGSRRRVHSVRSGAARVHRHGFRDDGGGAAARHGMGGDGGLDSMHTLTAPLFDELRLVCVPFIIISLHHCWSKIPVFFCKSTFFKPKVERASTRVHGRHCDAVTRGVELRLKPGAAPPAPRALITLRPDRVELDVVPRR